MADFTPADLEFVRLQRGRGASWAGIARMLGRPAPTLQAHFEPLLGARVEQAAAAQPVTPAVVAPAAEVQTPPPKRAQTAKAHTPARERAPVQAKPATPPAAVPPPSLRLATAPVAGPVVAKPSPQVAAWRVVLGDLARDAQTSRSLAELNGWKTSAAALVCLALADKGLAWKRRDGCWELTTMGRTRVIGLDDGR